MPTKSQSQEAESGSPSRQKPPLVHGDMITLRLPASLAAAVRTSAAAAGISKSEWLRDLVAATIPLSARA